MGDFATTEISRLEAAIARYKIPPWPYQAAYDRVIVFSVPEDKATRETYVEGGLIAKPASRQEYEKNTTPRGVLVSAGLGAQDVLRSHFMGLGDMVWVARLSPWRHVVDVAKDGREIEFLFLRVGDIVGSEDLLTWVRQGRVAVSVQPGGEHHYTTGDDRVLPRFDPPSYVG